ncbi:MAG: NAD(P)-dependent oxidoreductase [Candidatus Syntrophosphaera sp.]
MNIFVTGSNGFVGSRLMWELEERDHKVIGIDISDHCDAKPHPASLRGDIREPGDLEKAGSEFLKKHGAPLELIIHCAASKHDFGIRREEYFSHNKYGTKTLLDFAAKNNINKLLYISTVSVFGHPAGRSAENTPYAPDHPYGESKLAGELASIEWQKQDPARELMVLRPTVIYGPHNFANVYKLIRMLHRRPWVTLGNGRHVKSVVSLDSFIDMILFSLDLMKPGYQHFNCVDEPYITLRELMGIIASNPGFRLPRFTIPLNLAIALGRLFDIPAKIFSIDLPVNSDRMKKLGTETYFSAEKIRRAGYVQKRTIEDTISEMCEWYLRHG